MDYIFRIVSNQTIGPALTNGQSDLPVWDKQDRLMLVAEVGSR